MFFFFIHYVKNARVTKMKKTAIMQLKKVNQQYIIYSVSLHAFNAV